MWDERRRAYRRTTVGSDFTLPVVMLSLRSLLRKSFCKSFPHWTASNDGLSSLQQVGALTKVPACRAAPAAVPSPQERHAITPVHRSVASHAFLICLADRHSGLCYVV